jgi:hypothetical protein
MDRSSKSKAPSLSLIVPSNRNLPYSNQSAPVVPVPEHVRRLSPQTPSRGHVIAPAKQKRLFPISCRLGELEMVHVLFVLVNVYIVPTDQWFTTRIDRTWQVLDLKIWLLSKVLPTSVLPLPASYRPSSPVTFAAAPPPLPLRPSVSTSYQALTPSVGGISSNSLTSTASQHSALSISPITFAVAPEFPSRPSIPSSTQSTPPLPTLSSPTSPPPLSPNQRPPYPPLSPPAEALPHPSFPRPLIPERETSPRLSPDQDDDGVPLYPNPYGTVLDENFYDDDDDDDDDEVASMTPRSIPYSYNTGAPAISGLAALESNRTPSGRNFGGGTSTVEADLLRKARAIAKRWHVYSFSTASHPALLSSNRTYTPSCRACFSRTISHCPSTTPVRTSC